MYMRFFCLFNYHKKYMTKTRYIWDNYDKDWYLIAMHFKCQRCDLLSKIIVPAYLSKKVEGNLNKWWIKYGMDAIYLGHNILKLSPTIVNTRVEGLLNDK